MLCVCVAGQGWVGWGGVDHGLETNAVINKQKTQTYQVFCPLSSESGSTQGGLCKDQVQAAQATQTERCSPLGRSERSEAGVGSNTREEREVGCGGRGRGRGGASHLLTHLVQLWLPDSAQHKLPLLI